jgi:hypothetical protein
MWLDGHIRPSNYAFFLSAHKKYMKTLSKKMFCHATVMKVK